MSTNLNLTSYSAVQQATFVKLQFTENGLPVDVRLSSHNIPFGIDEGVTTPTWSTASSGLTWTTPESGIGESYPTKMIYNDEQFFLGGQNGKLATSTDGVTWTNSTSLSSTAFGTNDVTALFTYNTLVMAGGENGKVAVYIPATGWSNKTALAATTFGTSTVYDIAYGAGLYVVVGESGKVATTADLGNTWTFRSGLQSTLWGSGVGYVKLIKRCGTQFIAVGRTNGVTATATSTDGINWTYRGVMPAEWGTTIPTSACWNGSKLVMSGPNGKTAWTTDGITWTVVSGLSAVWGADIGSAANEIVWASDRFMAVGGPLNLGSPAKFATSSDGITWTEQYGTSGYLLAAAWNGTKLATINDSLDIIVPTQFPGPITYPAVGNLLGISEMTNEMKSSQSDVTITLSGIPTQYMTDILANPIKGSPVEIRRVFFDANTGQYLNIAGNPVLEFVGVVNNFSVDENWADPKSQTITTSISLVCSSTMSVLLNKIAGRRTNQADQDYWFTGDLAMDRVAVISDSVFDFGGTTPTTAVTPSTGKTITITG